MNSLTCNLHLMMVSFYLPSPDRHKILVEKKSFPSDYHAVCSQIKLHGYDPATSLIEVGRSATPPLLHYHHHHLTIIPTSQIAPREGEVLLRDEDIVAMIEQHGASISLVLLSGVQYYTGYCRFQLLISSHSVFPLIFSHHTTYQLLSLSSHTHHHTTQHH